MRVLILGATGDIGAAVADALAAGGHEVVALARSDASAAKVEARGLTPLPGDLRAPEAWIGAVRDVDAVVHAAGEFSDAMPEIDGRLLDALIAAAAGRADPLRLLYTGGCWLYGDTGDAIAKEASPYRPIPAFRYMADGIARILAAPELAPLILHPAMTYGWDAAAGGDGVFARFTADARAGRPVEVWGGLDQRWPLVHRDDLAAAYRLVLEQAPAGATYIAAAEDGVRLGDIVDRIQRRFGVAAAPVVRDVADAIAEHGAWALGPSLDQRLSGAKLRETLGWKPVHGDILAAMS